MHIATMEEIGSAIGVSKQMIKKYVDRKYLIRNKKKKIDIDNPHNLQFLMSKGANMAVFGVEIVQKEVEKPIKSAPNKHNKHEKKDKKQPIQPTKPVPRKKINLDGDEIDKNELELLDLDPIFEADLRYKFANIKAKQKDSELKTLRVEEARGKLIPRDLAERYVTDTIGQFVQTLVSTPVSLVDQIFSIVLTDKENKREELISLLQDKYAAELTKAAETGYKKYMRQLKEMLKEIERSSKDTTSN